MTCILVMIERNSRNKFHRNYLQNEKHVLELLFHFWNLPKILSILRKNITLITLIFPELLIAENVVTLMPQSSSFKTPFGNERLKGSETLLKSHWMHFYANFWLMSNKVRCVSCLLVASKMWGPSFKTLTPNGMYSCHNIQIFRKQVPATLSSKAKTFSLTFIEFLESREDFEYFDKKDDLDNFNISGVIDFEKCG